MLKGVAKQNYQIQYYNTAPFTSAKCSGEQSRSILMPLAITLHPISPQIKINIAASFSELFLFIVALKCDLV